MLSSTTANLAVLSIGSTYSFPDPRPPYPSLPPEILREIFGYLALTTSTHNLSDYLDLLACSLVCIAWHPFALEKIPYRLLQDRELKISDNFRRSDIARLGDIVHETRRLKLPTFDRVQIVRFDLWQIISDANYDSLHFPPPSYDLDHAGSVMSNLLSALGDRANELVVDHRGMLIHSVDDGRFRSVSGIFTRLAPFCRHVSRLALWDEERLLSRKEYPVIPLVETLKDGLRSVELLDVTYNDSLVDALQQCRDVKEAYIKLNILPEIRVLKMWRNLEVLRLRVHTNQRQIKRMLLEAALSCPCLQRLEVIIPYGAYENSNVTVLRLAKISLFKICTNLRHAIIDNYDGVADEDPPECTVFTRTLPCHWTSLAQEQARKNPRTLEFRSLEAPEITLVEFVVQSCPEVERLVVPGRLEDLEELKLLLGSYSFKPEADFVA
ncbi:hypothetical protein BC938DRAFT_478606 [Jimgerdemannia flammicorona]|uniref:F-box domain-containing protein n=1 Tax=Jimgerdemannia flammicorona TaxID=994334 RepID=A0A433QML1_9FUNG|nr:hypothetical protein BC938DRAFT_478606 [Jimgerdemannia flammicorona]